MYLSRYIKLSTRQNTKIKSAKCIYLNKIILFKTCSFWYSHSLELYDPALRNDFTLCKCFICNFKNCYAGGVTPATQKFTVCMDMPESPSFAQRKYFAWLSFSEYVKYWVDLRSKLKQK